MAKSVSNSLAAAARAATGVKGPRADVVRLAVELATKDPALHAEFVDAINDPDVPGMGLARAMQARGWQITGQTINRWRLNGGRL